MSTLQQTIELAFKLNEQAADMAARTFAAMGTERVDAYRSAEEVLSSVSATSAEDRNNALESYMRDYERVVRSKTDVEDSTVNAMLRSEREHARMLLDSVAESNRRITSESGLFYRDLEEARMSTIDTVAESESRIRSIKSSPVEKAKGVGEGLEEVAEEVLKAAAKATTLLERLGIAVLNVVTQHGIEIMLEVYERRLREIKTEYQIAAVGGQLHAGGMTTDMEAYTKGMTRLIVDFPHLREEYGQVAVTLKSNLPYLEATELVTMVDDVRRISFFTGEDMAKVATDMSEMGRILRVPADQLAAKTLFIVELGRLYVRTHDVNIDLAQFRDNVAQLALRNRAYGLTIEDAGKWAFKFAKELDKGLISLDDVASVVLGFSRSSPTQQAFLGRRALTSTLNQAEFGELRSLFNRVSDSPVAISRLIQGIMSRSKTVYREMGIYDTHFNQSDQLANQLSKALHQTLFDLAETIGGSPYEKRHWLRSLAEEWNVVSSSTPIGQAEKLLRAGREGVAIPLDMPSTAAGLSPEEVAASPIRSMDSWRNIVDENQQLTSSILESLWNRLMQPGGGRLTLEQAAAATGTELPLEQPPMFSEESLAEVRGLAITMLGNVVAADSQDAGLITAGGTVMERTGYLVAKAIGGTNVAAASEVPGKALTAFFKALTEDSAVFQLGLRLSPDFFSSLFGGAPKEDSELRDAQKEKSGL